MRQEFCTCATQFGLAMAAFWSLCLITVTWQWLPWRRDPLSLWRASIQAQGHVWGTLCPVVARQTGLKCKPFIDFFFWCFVILCIGMTFNVTLITENSYCDLCEKILLESMVIYRSRSLGFKAGNKIHCTPKLDSFAFALQLIHNQNYI